MDAGLYYGHRRKNEAAGASGVLIPVEAEDSSADAYAMLDSQIRAVSLDYDVDIDRLGLVVNKFDKRKGYVATHSLENWESLGEPPVVAVVPDLKEQREAVHLKQPLMMYAPHVHAGAAHARDPPEARMSIAKKLQGGGGSFGALTHGPERGRAEAAARSEALDATGRVRRSSRAPLSAIVFNPLNPRKTIIDERSRNSRRA